MRKYILELDETEINSIAFSLKQRALNPETAKEWQDEYRRLGREIYAALCDTRSPIETINRLALNAGLFVQYNQDGSLTISEKQV